MSTTIPKTTKQHKVGTCPACSSGLWADVDIEVEVHEPTIHEGRAHVFASPRMVGMRLAHSCNRDEEEL